MGKAFAEMLSVTGDPGAIGLAVALALGLFIAVLGCRYVKFAAAVVGFALGAGLAGRVVMDQGGSALTTAIVGGLAGVGLAVVFVLYRRVASVGLGAALWAALATLAVPAVGARDHLMCVLPAAIVGGAAGLLLPKLVLRLSTAFFGGVAAAACGFALVAERSCASLVTHIPPQGGILTDGVYHRIYFIGCVALLVTAALVLQDRMGEGARAGDA